MIKSTPHLLNCFNAGSSCLVKRYRQRPHAELNILCFCIGGNFIHIDSRIDLKEIVIFAPACIHHDPFETESLCKINIKFVGRRINTRLKGHIKKVDADDPFVCSLSGFYPCCILDP